MKKIVYFISSILLILSSCSDEGFEPAGNGLVLTLDVPEMTATRAAGVDDLNENKIEVIDVFMFKSGEDQAAVYRHLNVAENKQFIRLSNNEIAALGNSNFDVMVVANLPDTSAVTNQRTKAQINAISLNADFSQKPQPSFVMKAECTTTGSGGAYEATAELRRIAAKFAIGMTFPAPLNGVLDGESGPWTADAKNVTVKMYNCQTNGLVSGNPASPASATNYTDEGVKIGDAYFYTYPRHVRADQRPYFVAKVPVTNDAVNTYCYYKFILDHDDFAPNTLYKITADIQLLGGEDEPQAETLSEGEYSYLIADWKAVEGYDSSVEEARYLMIYNDNYVMENVNEIEIPFASSHTCHAEVVRNKTINDEVVNPFYYNFSTTATTPPKVIVDESKYTCEVHNDKQVIVFRHELDNDWLSTNSNYDVSPYEFTISIGHEEGGRTPQYIKIIQNPAIVITNEYNSYSNGYEYVNGARSATNLGGYTNVGSQTQNMFIIRVSALPAGSDYIIGDPRDFSDERWKFTGSSPALTSAPDIKNNTNRNTLLNYYPTRDDGTADNVIAPVIRTSSAWGRLSSYNNNYETVKKRAATYQEGGYPAGRWRLLTKAEAKILAKLNADNKIPDLFSTSNNFLVAGGYIKGQNVSNGTTVMGSVRLCYDEWYWSESKYAKANPLNQFTWGDMPRNEFE